ncbi:MAG: secondary thiamine-phosphate synthase enzyme YjbQ [Tropicimonas sp.]|uniref:secondary thiamine-phosphate synthase enzyme YjbQ n=1 Tax=Tropicimonas sp. TaxID=2067044 RepID=UPI003A8B7AA1
MQRLLDIETRGSGLYEFTPRLQAWLREIGAGDGLCTLLVRHTSASLLIQENADAEVQTDLRGFFERLVPPADHPSMRFLRHTHEGPDDMPAHIKSALLPVSLGIPVLEGRMMLGTWQGVYLFEHRARPHRRQIALHFA